MNLNISDLEQVLYFAKKDILSLKHTTIFISGGTGYIGKWILENLIFSNIKLDLKIKIFLLSRNPKKFISNFPEIASNKALKIIKGDIRNFKYPKGQVDYVIHAAADVVNINSAKETFDVITNGTKNMLKFCNLKNVSHVLILSSGAVYGKVPLNLKFISENYFGNLKYNKNSAYGLGKLISEWMGSLYTQNTETNCKFARIFAQVGPYIPLEKHFAVGNLILNAIDDEDLLIKGDGKVNRSYMYGSDLVIWLLAILLRGKKSVAYNVGSDKSISIKQLAKKILIISGNSKSKVKILNKKNIKLENYQYIPDISLAKKELSLQLRVSLDESLRNTIDWYKRIKFNK